jgi:S-DNA-T family DNA segregation ATPase FtsK/SpoIIIE
MINEKYLECFNGSRRDDRNIVSKDKLSKFVEDNYFNGVVKEVHTGVTATRYDIEVKPKSIQYFLSLQRQFNAFFNTNNCQLFQNGKYVCVEVLNKYKGVYGFKDCLSSLQLMPHNSDSLYVSIGESIDGNNINYNLVDMPHLLIGGQTGSGKSVFIHNLILSLLLQYSEDEVRLLLIDPKAVEFEFYHGAPQILEIVTDGERASRKIRDMCDLMDDRYKIFAEKACRDISSYNKVSEVKMPRIVVFIEELADLILSQGKEVLDDIIRLTVKARACGIHIVLATQRPDAEFMTGKLKSNFQCRISFSAVDVLNSRLILGKKGAEVLGGKGDGYFRSHDGQKLTRFQSALITEKEIKKAVSLLKGE